MRRALLLAIGLFLATPALAGDPLVPQATPPAPRFNKLYPYEQIVGFLQGYARSYPGFVKLESIGKSGGGRDMWLMTITNPNTGPELRKPPIRKSLRADYVASVLASRGDTLGRVGSAFANFFGGTEIGLCSGDLCAAARPSAG